MKLLTAAQMRELDRRTIEEIGIPGIVLMENAGRGAAELIERRFAELFPGPVLVAAGKGNNGGDGYVVARRLLDGGWKVRTVVLAPRGLITGDAAVNLEILLRLGGEVVFAFDESSLDSALLSLSDSRLIVDALFGTGLATAVRGHYARAIERINAAGIPVVAIDIPSGVDATGGKILGRAVRADLTVTFGAAKTGHAVHPGAALAGDLAVVDIGIPPSLADGSAPLHMLVEAQEAARLLPPRPVTGHKGTFGHLLVVAGSVGMTGAAAMTAQGGLRIGSGLVTLASPRGAHAVLAAKLTEAMIHPLPGEDALEPSALEELTSLCEGKNALALGPGLGQKEETFAFARELIPLCPVPLILDADGLNAVADSPELLLQRGAPTVLTPHPGEMARLIRGTVAQVEGDRIGAAREFARRYGVVLVLKGARTITALPDGEVRINGSGNPGLASGGMGDVLTGVIGGLLAQGVPAGDAATLGVFLHGLAADRLSRILGTAGMTATDVLREIPPARHELVSLR